MDAPTFEPQPPHRIAALVNSRISSDDATPGVSGSVVSITGKSTKRLMNRRSIQSFHRHTHEPSNDNLPRDATAY